jgi:hypothetical protein
MINLNFLLLGAFNRGALENIYKAQFERLGIHTTCIDIVNPYYEAVQASLFNKAWNKIAPGFFYEPINRRLLQDLKGHYDVIIVFKGMYLTPETVSCIKSITRLLICYNPDHPFVFYSQGSGNANVEKAIRHYDVYYTYSDTIAMPLAERYGVRTGVIPFGYDDRLSPSVSSSNRASGKIIFVGTYDKERACRLSELKTKELLVFGDSQWVKLKTRVANNAYAGYGLYDQDYADAAAQALGVLNFLRPQNLITQSHNMRTFEVPGYGGLLISNRTEEQSLFFTDNEEAIYFDSSEELNDKINFLERHPAFADTLKKNALRKSQVSGYAYSKRAEDWLRDIKGYLN